VPQHAHELRLLLTQTLRIINQRACMFEARASYSLVAVQMSIVPATVWWLCSCHVLAAATRAAVGMAEPDSVLKCG
jgi:hypothetical protein